MVMIGMAALVSLGLHALVLIIERLPGLSVDRVANLLISFSAGVLVGFTSYILFYLNVPDRGDLVMMGVGQALIIAVSGGVIAGGYIVLKRASIAAVTLICWALTALYFIAHITVIFPAVRGESLVAIVVIGQMIALPVIATILGRNASSSKVDFSRSPVEIALVVGCATGLFMAACSLPYTSHTTRLVVLERTVMTPFILDMLPLCRASSIGLPAFECPPEEIDASLPIDSPELDVLNRPRGLVVVVADTLRYDRVYPHGDDDIVAPNIRRIADEGISFSRLYTPAPRTRHTLGKFSSGTYEFPVEAQHSSRLMTWLYEQGLESHIIALEARFEEFFRDATTFDRSLYISNLPGGRRQLTSEDVTTRAMEMLNSIDSEARFFAVVHYYDPHAPYLFVDDFDHGLSRRSRYDAMVRYTDRWIGEFVDELYEGGEYDDVAILLLTDHGEEFGDHRDYYHQFGLYDESTRLVAAFYWPDELPSATVSVPVSVIDLFPTMAALLGEPVTEVDGVSLWNFEDEAAEPPCVRPPLLVAPRGVRLGMVRDRYKLIINPYRKIAEVYDLEKDPGETKNLADRKPALLNELVCQFETERRARNPSWRP